MNVGLADFVRMANTLAIASTSAINASDGLPSKTPLTIRILAELAESPGTASEIASILGENQQHVSGSICNMRDSGYVKTQGNARSRTRPAFIYVITNAGLRRLKQWRGE